MSSRRERLVEYVTAELLLDPEEGLTDDEELLASGRIDSFGLVRLVSFIGGEFAVTVPTEHLVVENFRSVMAIDDYLGRRERGTGV